VARPKIPLISKRAALQAALDIIDTEGIDALSIRYLAEKLGVNGASLYHHFQNKDEIVVGAATAERILGFFVLENLGEKSFKNVSQPLRVYRIIPPGVYDKIS